MAVKIIEHYGVDAQASSGSRRISAHREMLFAGTIQHPNVVSAVAGLQGPAGCCTCPYRCWQHVCQTLQHFRAQPGADEPSLLAVAYDHSGQATRRSSAFW